MARAAKYVGVYAKRGILVRCIYLGVAVFWWLLTGLGRLSRGRALVLCYHGLLARQRDRFKWQMKLIAPRTISLSEVSAVKSYLSSLLRVSVTFDDAFACLIENALPITQDLNIPVTIFAVTENLGAVPRWKMPADHPEVNEPVMSTDQIISTTGNRLNKFGSHTMTHPSLVEIPLPQLMEELTESREILEKLLGVTIDGLALPYGSYNENVLQAASEAGYQRIFSLEPSLCSNKNSNSTVGRFSISPDIWKVEFFLTCAGAYAWLYPWRHFIGRLRSFLKKAL